jgi:pSer/pThr/pTyr-binding forkhead associated (FHA) protein
MSAGTQQRGGAVAGDAFERFEDDEIPGEVTRLEPAAMLAEQPTSRLEEEAPKPTLYCEAGKDTGKEYVVVVGENGIGRSIDNEVILTDISVSRKHLKVLRDAAGQLRLRDLGSGNGTLLNGARAHDAPLAHGDRIELGETVLVVRIPGTAGARLGAAPVPAQAPRVGAGPVAGAAGAFAAPPPRASEPAVAGHPAGPPPGAAPPGPGPSAHGGPTPVGLVAPSPLHGAPPGYAPTPTAVASPAPRGVGRGALVLLGVLGAFVLVGAGAALAVVLMGPEAPAEEAADPALYARGAEAYAGRRWDEADVAFRAILAAQPGDARASTYLQRIQDARAHDQQLTAARASYAAGDARTALGQLASVPATSPIAADVASLRAAAGERVAVTLVGEARVAAAAGRNDEAGARLAEAAGFAPTSAVVAQARAELGNASAVPGVAGVPAAGVPAAGVPAAGVPAVSASAALVSPAPTAVAAVAPPAPAPAAAPEPASPRSAPPRAVQPRPAAPAPRAAPSVRAEPPSRAAPAAAGPSRGGSGTERVLAAYRSGDFAGAAQRARDDSRGAAGADARRLTSLADQIDRFARDYARVRAAGANLAPVLRQVQSAISLDEQISGGQAYARTLGPRLVEALVAGANEAWSRGRIPDACLKVRQAVDLDARNPRARDLVRRCETKAGEMLAEAQAAERSDRAGAQALYRDVLALVPQSSATYQRAYSRMQALNRAPASPSRPGSGPAPRPAAGPAPRPATGPAPRPAPTSGPRRVPVIVDEDE